MGIQIRFHFFHAAYFFLASDKGGTIYEGLCFNKFINLHRFCYIKLGSLLFCTLLFQSKNKSIQFLHYRFSKDVFIHLIVKHST